MKAPTAQRCSTGKAGLIHRKDVDGIASSFARQLNRSGRLVEDMYTYRCSVCSLWHLTRRAVYRGTANSLVHRAAPEELQRWAMPQRAVDAEE